MSKVIKKKMTSKEQINKKGFWQNELRSLGIEPKQNKEELNDDVELKILLIESSYQCIKIIKGRIV